MKEWEVDFTIDGHTSFFCDTKAEAEKRHMITCRNYAKAYTPIAVPTATKLRTYIAIRRNNMQKDKLIVFLEAQQEAEDKGKHEFICPICKGMAWWDRAKTNGHIRIKCDGCGIAVIE